MIAYIRGSFDDAMNIAKQWALQNNRKVVFVSDKNWHDHHDLANDKCFVAGPKAKIVECDDCIVFAFGHTPPKGTNYLKIKQPSEELTLDDFIQNYHKFGDYKRDPEYAVMMGRVPTYRIKRGSKIKEQGKTVKAKKIVSKRIIGSWLYVNWDEKRQKMKGRKK